MSSDSDESEGDQPRRKRVALPKDPLASAALVDVMDLTEGVLDSQPGKPGTPDSSAPIRQSEWMSPRTHSAHHISLAT